MALLSLAGYGYLAGVTLGLALLCLLPTLFLGRGGVWLTLKVGLPLLFVVIAVMQAIIVRPAPPVGKRLDPGRLPELAGLIADLRARLRCPPIHEVVLTAELNASVTQRPAWVLAGPLRNVLTVGLPLMHLLGPEQFRAVVAHEIAHLSAAHGRVALWVYRTRLLWMHVAYTMPARNAFTWPIRVFLSWYVPYFGAYSQALARSFERQADRLAVDASDGRALAGALVALQLGQELLAAEVEPALAREVAASSEPPSGTVTTLCVTARSATRSPLADSWLARGLASRGVPGDTHPPLAERVSAALPEVDADRRQLLALLESEGPSAAERWLGASAPALAKEVDEAWRQAAHTEWRQAHHAAAGMERELVSLEARAAGGLSRDEQLTRVRLVADLRGPEDAAPLARELAAERPDDAVALLVAGSILLEIGEDEGLALVHRAATVDPATSLPAYQAAAAHLWRTGRTREAGAVDRRIEQLVSVPELAPGMDLDWLIERSELAPHALRPERLAELSRQVRGAGQVERAYLVCADLPLDPPRPVHLLAVVPGAAPVRRIRDGRDVAELAGSLTSAPPGTVLVVLERRYRAWESRIASVPGAAIVGRAADAGHGVVHAGAIS